MVITLPRVRDLCILLGIVLFLAVSNLINNATGQPFWTITRHIWLGADDNCTAWYSSLLLALAGLVAYQCAVLARVVREANRKAFHLLVALLLLMSCDEIARLHETVFGDIAKSSDIGR